MIQYNTQESHLIMPEYGRNIQKLVDYCVKIEDRDERRRCAESICSVMLTLFPSVGGDNENRQKVWDHLNIISGFKLDIDFPCEVVTEEELSPVPERIPYSGSLYRFRHYGRNLQEMIRKVADMENCIEKDQIIFLLANQMKKQLVEQTPENVSDERVFGDIAEISEGKITIDGSSYRLNDYIGVVGQQPTKGKKKKNK